MFDPTPIGHSHIMNVRMLRVFIKDSVDPMVPMKHEPTLVYAFCYTASGFGIRDFIVHLRQFGYGPYTPVAREGPYDIKTGRRYPPERFGDVVWRHWALDMEDISTFSTNCHVFGLHSWSFAQLAFRLSGFSAGSFRCGPS